MMTSVTASIPLQSRCRHRRCRCCFCTVTSSPRQLWFCLVAESAMTSCRRTWMFTSSTTSLVAVVALLVVCTQPAATVARSYGGEYCDTEVFRAECADGERIIIERARYGRMKLGRCVEIDLGYLGCQRDVLYITDRRCSGRRVCEIRIPDSEFESTRACLKELKTYLDVGYRCITPESIDSDNCRSQDTYNVTMTSTQPTGFISSDALSEVPAACNRPDRPWLISARPGQRINLTLYNFTPLRPQQQQQQQQQPEQQQLQLLSASSSSLTSIGHGIQRPAPAASDDSSSEDSPTQFVRANGRCRQPYGRLEDSGLPTRGLPPHSGLPSRPMRICATERRIEPLIVSHGNVVRLWIDGFRPNPFLEQTEPYRFLVHYSVIGCPDVSRVPEFGWFRRYNDSVALIGCWYNPEVTWSLLCRNGAWLSTYGNCSSPPTSRPTTTAVVTVPLTDSPPLAYANPPSRGKVLVKHDVTNNSAVITLSLLVIVAFLIVLFVLLIVLVQRRRRLRHGCVGCCSWPPLADSRGSSGADADVKLCETTLPPAVSSSPIQQTAPPPSRQQQPLQQQQQQQQRHLVNVNGDRYEHVWPQQQQKRRKTSVK